MHLQFRSQKDAHTFVNTSVEIEVVDQSKPIGKDKQMVRYSS